MKTKFLLLITFIIFSANCSFGADSKKAIIKRLNNIIKLEESFHAKAVKGEEISSGAFTVAETALAILSQDISLDRITIAKSIKKDFLSLLNIAKKTDAAARKGTKAGASPESIALGLAYALDVKYSALELIKNPKEPDCDVDFEFKTYGQPPDVVYPRDEVFVRCNVAWNRIEITLTGGNPGQIGNVWRGYALTSRPDPYPGGSISCENNLTNAACDGYLAKAGATGSLALGIYDNPGTALMALITVKNARGATIYSEEISPQ